MLVQWKESMGDRIRGSMTIKSSLGPLNLMSVNRFLAFLTFGIFQMVPAAVAQPFQPVNQLTSWYTDRSPIDVEIVGTKGVGPEARLVSPPRVLQVRLERAYVQLLIRRDQPPSSHASFSFDLPTGLPSALFRAPPEQVEARGDPIRQLTEAERTPRTVNVSLAGSDLPDNLDLASSELRGCKGKKVQDDLFLFDKDQGPSCFRWSLAFGNKYIAQYSDNVQLLVLCSRAPLGCQMFFPFEGFLASISFNESHLAAWRAITEKVTDFLQSKKYR
jgi:hypothetical protein